jgi:antimicrobial peptide system SdpA family protein
MLQQISNFVVSVKYSIFSILISILGIITVFLVFTSSIPFNPVQSDINYAEEVLMYTPQGWAFFTRDAREEQVYIYKIENNKLVKINQRHAEFRNFLGLSRKVSQLGLEADIITNIIGKRNFTATTWNYSDNLLGKIPKRFIQIHNPIKSPVLCGDYVIVYHSVVPWAWSKSKRKIPMPAKVIKLKIKC